MEMQKPRTRASGAELGCGGPPWHSPMLAASDLASLWMQRLASVSPFRGFCPQVTDVDFLIPKVCAARLNGEEFCQSPEGLDLKESVLKGGPSLDLWKSLRASTHEP